MLTCRRRNGKSQGCLDARARARALEISGLVCEKFSPPSRQRRRTLRSSSQGCGGVLYVPKSVAGAKRHPVFGLLGCIDAEKLVKEFGGETLRFGMCQQTTLRKRNELMRRMRAEGRSDTEIARTFNVTDRTVRNVLRGEPKPGNLRMRTSLPEIGSAIRPVLVKLEMFKDRVKPISGNETLRSYFKRCELYASVFGRSKGCA